MSSTPDRTLDDPQQVIAELQRQLAERTAELNEAQQQLNERTAERDEGEAQKAAISEVLGVINSSPGDLAPVFDAILEKAMRLCEAAFGNLKVYDGNDFRPGAMRGLPPRYAAYLATTSDEHAGSQRALRGENVIQEIDLMEAERYRAGHPSRRALVDLGGARSNVVVALRKDSAFLGTITIYRQEVRPFTDQQIALLQNFAAQAVIAMENARLITETREALERQTATAEVLQVINSSPGDLAPVFDAMLEKAMRLSDSVYGHLLLYDGEFFDRVAVRGNTRMVERQSLRRRAESGITLGRIVRGESVVQIADVMDTDAYRSGNLAARVMVDEGDCRTLLTVALRKEDILIGTLSVYRRGVRPFTDKQIALLQNFAAQAVIAVENARLITETREALERQTATAEVLQVINASPGDLAPVFDAILEKAHTLCGAATGSLQLDDGEFVRAVATRGLPDEFVKILQQPRRTGFRDAFLRGAPFVQITDLADPVLTGGDDTTVAGRDIAGVRTLLRVPLRKDNALLGWIVAGRREIRPFSQQEISLLQNFAAQAVISMENARLITETREALERQTATAEVLGVINASPGDLAPVFDAMLEKAMRLCDAAFGTFATFDGSTLRTAATRGVPAEYAAFRMNNPPVYGPKTAPGRFIAGERLIHNIDLKAEDAYREGEPNRRALVDIGGARSALQVALRKDDALLGSMTIYRQEVRPFTDKQIALLQNFAAQAVIAMENARLITETREALEQQTATAEVLQVINSSPGDLAPVFDAILEKAHSLCGVAFGSLQLYEDGKFRAVAVRGLPSPIADRLRSGYRPRPKHPMRGLLDGDRFVHIHDLSQVDTPEAQVAVEHGSRTLLFIPLRKDDALLGQIVAVRQEVRPFSDKQIALLENFAAQAVIAMENARLLGELRQRTEEVGELNRDLEARVAEQVDELGRVGRLKRFLAPQLAELIVSQGDEKILESHRREIVVVFCDLRGYTAFTETAEPEEVLDFLRQYHGALGPLVSQYEGTLDQFSGDGIMVFFNDPVPIPDPAERAVKMAVVMREAARELIAAWSRHGCELGFGVGIAQGFATLGQIGFSERSGYTAIGTVCNLAARLCAEAKDGQILISSRIAEAVEAVARLEDLGNLELKGLRRPVAAFNVARSTSPAEARPNLTVVARDRGSDPRPTRRSLFHPTPPPHRRKTNDGFGATPEAGGLKHGLPLVVGKRPLSGVRANRHPGEGQIPKRAPERSHKRIYNLL